MPLLHGLDQYSLTAVATATTKLPFQASVDGNKDDNILCIYAATYTAVPHLKQD